MANHSLRPNLQPNFSLLALSQFLHDLMATLSRSKGLQWRETFHFFHNILLIKYRCKLSGSLSCARSTKLTRHNWQKLPKCAKKPALLALANFEYHIYWVKKPFEYSFTTLRATRIYSDQTKPLPSVLNFLVVYSTKKLELTFSSFTCLFFIISCQ